MGDPVGPEESADDAAWKFREACDAAGVWPVFYQTDERSLSRYIDMGLSLRKLGEEARVRLPDFSLSNSSCKDLRRTNKKAVEEGVEFEISPQSQVDEFMPGVKVISNAWLGGKNPLRKKDFHCAHFMKRICGDKTSHLIRCNDKPKAFANL